MTSVEFFKAEIERLNNELQQASCDKVRAAEYGLAVLEEKQTLQEQCDELETLLENTKQELESTKEVGKCAAFNEVTNTIFRANVDCSFIKRHNSMALSFQF